MTYKIIFIKKNVNSALIGTHLKQLFDEQEILSEVILGLTTDTELALL